LKVITYVVTVVASLAFSSLAIAHDAKGLHSEEDSISKLTPAAQRILRAHQALQDPEAQADAIERAQGVALPQAVIKREPLDPGMLPDAVPPTALQGVLEQVGQANARWQPGQSIKVCFLDGADAARSKFMAVAAEMVTLTNLHLDPAIVSCGASGAQVHVSFEDSGYYSYVGTDALYFGENVATLNLEGMGSHGNWADAWVGVARHEIGHMLSMLHEHQHPDMDCGFKSDQDIATLLGWTIAEVQTNFARIRMTANILKTQYDPKSEMHYQLDPIFYQAGTNSPCYITSANVVLSPGDVAFLQLAYPL